MNTVRPAAVAGTFYPDDPEILRGTVVGLLRAVEPANDGVAPKAIIAPHAGYRYSGAIAAKAYARLKPAADRIDRVVLLGPCHRVAVRGLAAPSVDAFASPLGEIQLDRAAIERLLDMPQVSEFDATHGQEHSLEVHLPFLQVLLKSFRLVPLVVGDAKPVEVMEVLDALWGGPETLIVISSDLSHFLDYEGARIIDRRTCAAIEALDGAAIEREGACGRYPVRGLLAKAKRDGMRVETVDLCNSGDTAGPRDRVVGYGAWAFYEQNGSAIGEEDPTAAMIRQFGPALLNVAVSSIANGLNTGSPRRVNRNAVDPVLSENGACFVTLKKDGRLRGCIGSPEAHQPLIDDIAQNAFRAAFKDPRFPPLESSELSSLSLSISILSPQSEMNIKDEADLLAQLRPGEDGLVIADGGRRALFLPSVWTQLPDRTTFLQHLKKKAGLPIGHWSPGFRAWRFSAHEIIQPMLTRGRNRPDRGDA